MTSQVGPLVALRWRMVRSTRAQRGFLALAAAVPVLCLVAAVVGATAPRGSNFDVLLLAPSAYLTVALLTVAAPLIAGGGHELFPTEQLDAYPVTARTQFLASVMLTPLNLAWTTQLIALVGLTTFVSDTGPGVGLSLLTCLAFLAAVTLAGQAFAWFVIGIRQRAWGRQLSWAVATALAAAVALTALTGNVAAVLDHAPTTWVVAGAVHGAAGHYRGWATVTWTLLAAAWVAYRLGLRSCTWSLRQPTGTGGGSETRSVRRRGQAPSALRAHLAIDRASVWRSSSLRRGLLVLGILPGAVSALAGLQWASLVMLPGLVAAGAGLLFGVNAFCLDGTGARWLASLPGDDRVLFRAKAQVVAEVCVVAVALAVVAGATRAGRPPTAAEAVALVELRPRVGLPGRRDLYASVRAATAPGRPARSARHARPAWRDGRLLRAAGRLDDARRGALLRSLPARRLAAAGRSRRAIRAAQRPPPRGFDQIVDGSGGAGARGRDRVQRLTRGRSGSASRHSGSRGYHPFGQTAHPESLRPIP